MKMCNLIGPQVRDLREERRWTQQTLAEKLKIAGLDISLSSLAKIEARLVRVHDFELFYFACAFNVSLSQLLPSIHQNDPALHDKLMLVMNSQD